MHFSILLPDPISILNTLLVLEMLGKLSLAVKIAFFSLGEAKLATAS